MKQIIAIALLLLLSSLFLTLLQVLLPVVNCSERCLEQTISWP